MSRYLLAAAGVLVLVACDPEPAPAPSPTAKECDIIQTFYEQQFPNTSYDVNGDGWFVACVAAELIVQP